jgi:RND superfamily putative drug exporter
MLLDRLRWVVCRHPWQVVAVWAVITAAVVALAPNLTRLAAEGQARLVPSRSESAEAAELIRRAWPDQAYESVAVVLLHRPTGLTEADHQYADKVAQALQGPEKPAPLLRVLGPRSQKEVAQYLVSKDGTSQIVAAQLGTSFVSPVTQQAVADLERILAKLPPPAGLEVRWTGDAVFGRDYMQSVQKSLDNAAIATVFLLLIVLLFVYRSLLLAMVPLVTIGVGLGVSRGVLAWMTQAGWEMSPLVELFLVVILFGCGTDFVLFISWRFGEHWNSANPAGAMRVTLRHAIVPLLTSAGTVIAGLSLMGLTRFKLFSATGPSVALGLALTLVATLTLTPALLILLARYRPKAFAGLTAPSSGFWDMIGRAVLARPRTIALATIVFLGIPAIIGFNLGFVQDMVAELPGRLDSVQGMDLISRKFGAGQVAPLTVLLKSPDDLRKSEGLAMIDDVSRLLTHQRRLLQVRSATQPLGSTKPLEPARLAARLEAVDEGFARMEQGATLLRDGLNQGAARLRTAIMLEEMTGLNLSGTPPTEGAPSTREQLVSGLASATGALFGGAPVVEKPKEPEKSKDAEKTKTAEGPRELMLRELARAADGAAQIADGARKASHEVRAILTDPVGRNALNRLLITPENIREHPELRASLANYISPDGHYARIDLVQADRLFSPEALDQVVTLRRQIREWLAEIKDEKGRHPGAAITGANAQAADTRAVTRSDQVLSWILVPSGVFLILLITLRDPLACLNLVMTMVLTYLFALGVTHLVFVNLLGAEGLDWKVPYFLFVLLVAVGVDYNVFLMTRLQEEAAALGLRAGIIRAVAQTGGLISSAAAITASSFAALLFSPLSSLRQLGLALVVGITVDAVLVRPVLVPCGQWLVNRRRDRRRAEPAVSAPSLPALAAVAD